MIPRSIRRRRRAGKRRETFHGIDFTEATPRKPRTLLEKVQAKKAEIEAVLEDGRKVFLCPSCITGYHLGQLARTRLSLEGQLVARTCAMCGKKKLCEIRGA